MQKIISELKHLARVEVFRELESEFTKNKDFDSLKKLKKLNLNFKGK